MTTELTPQEVRALREQAEQAEADHLAGEMSEEWMRRMRLSFKGIFSAAERRRVIERMAADDA